MSEILERLQRGLPERYTLERELGRGGMARVYLARERHPQRLVAIKVLEPSVAVSLGRERFLREIDVVSNLTHPHIVPIFAAGEADDLLYFVMPFVDGETLSARIKREGTLSLSSSLRIAGEVAGALEYAHRRNIVHRDVKPDNILLHDGYALVTDFGVARAIRAAGTEQLTEIGITLGTPAYMSPEQASGEIQIDGRTDTYALGCVVCEMLTGDPPFGKGSPQAILSKHITELAPSLHSRNTGIPVEIDDAVQKALTKSKDERYATAGEFGEALELFRSGLTSGSGIHAHGHPVRPAFGWRGRLAAALLLVAVVAVTWTVARRTSFAGLPEPQAFTDSVAFMPVENLTADSSLGPLGDALTYGVINWLEKIPGLKMPGYTSIRSFDGTDLDVSQLAESLGVRLIVASRFRRLGGGVRLEAELHEAASGRDIAADNWPVDSRDEEQAERDLVGQLAGMVTEATGFSGESGPQIMGGSPVHALYLAGKDSVGRRTPSAVRRAIGYFGAAITVDSLYAPAYEGMSNAYALALFYRYEIGMDGYTVAGRALAHAERAIELDQEYAYGYAARGYLISRMSGSVRDAARDFRRALQRAPNASQAVTWSGWVRAQAEGKGEEGLEATLRGAKLNPYAPFAHLSAAYSAFQLDSNRLAIAETHRTLELEPDIVAASALLGRALLLDGRPAECVELKLGPHEGVRAACLHALGRVEEAQAIADSIDRAVQLSGISDPVYTAVIRAEDLACYYAWIGNNRMALQWLTKAYQLSPIGVDQRVLGSRLFESLRQDEEAAKELDQITARIWPEVERHADQFR